MKADLAAETSHKLLNRKEHGGNLQQVNSSHVGFPTNASMEPDESHSAGEGLGGLEREVAVGV